MIKFLVALLLAIAVIGAGSASPNEHSALADGPLPQAVLSRVVFLGDSVTDGYTYPQLVRDSLAKSMGIRMVAINAGVGGDMMSKMHARLQRDVLDHNPTLVTISAGDNDAVRGVTADQYGTEMRAVVEELRARHIDVILLTPIWQPGTRAITDSYEAEIRKIAADDHLAVAEVTKTMIENEAAGQRQHSLDNHHPGYMGQHSIARAILDAMGYANVPVVDRVNAILDSDVIRNWMIRPVVKGEPPITDEIVGKIVPDSTWRAVNLPFAAIDTTGSDLDSLEWLDDFRREGMATQLDKNVVSGDTFISVARIDAASDEQMHLQTGGDTQKVWLNGTNIFTLSQTPYFGWHPGRDSIRIALKKGANEIVALSGKTLWVRVAAQPLWQDDPQAAP